MRKFFAPLFIAAIAFLSFQCGSSREQQEADRRLQKLTDSITQADAIAQRHTNDSVHRADSIRSLPCPELAEYIRLSDRGIAMMKTATTDDDIKRVNKTMDSITAVEKKLTVISIKWSHIAAVVTSRSRSSTRVISRMD